MSTTIDITNSIPVRASMNARLPHVGRIRELSPGFGVEVNGIDFGQGATVEDQQYIQQLVTKVCSHSILFIFIQDWTN